MGSLRPSGLSAGLKTVGVAFGMCFLGIFLCANVPNIGFDDTPIQVGLSGDMTSRGAKAAGYEIRTVMYVLDKDYTSGHHDPLYDARIAAADTVIELDSEAAFSICSIGETYPYAIAGDGSTGYIGDGAYDQAGGVDDNWTVQDSNGGFTIFDVDLGAIPEGSQILDARYVAINVNWNSITATYADSFVTVTLDTADSYWKNAEGIPYIGTGWVLDNYGTCTSWSYQVQGHDTADAEIDSVLELMGAPAVSSHPWSFGLGNTDFVWDFGAMQTIREPVLVEGVSSGYGNWTGYAALNWDISKYAQSKVNGEPVGGALIGMKVSSVSGNGPYIFAPRVQSLGTMPDRVPYIWIEYSTRKYRSPYPEGYDGFLVMSTDGGYVAINDSMSAIFDSAGVAYTVYAVGDQRKVGDRWGWPELVRWHDRGMEISAQKHHWEPWNCQGLGQSDDSDLEAAAALMQPFGDPDTGPNAITTWALGDTTLDGAATCWDSLMFNYDQSWLVAGMSSEAGEDLSGDPLIGVTAFASSNKWTQEVLIAMARLDMIGLRADQATRAIATPSGHYEFGQLASAYADSSDTLRAWVSTENRRNPIDAFAQLRSTYTSAIYNNGANDEATTKALLRRHAIPWLAAGLGCVSFMAHESDWTPDQMRWTLEVADELNLKVCSVAEYQRWRRSNGIPIATPRDYARPSWRDFERADQVWMVPYLYGRGDPYIPLPEIPVPDVTGADIEFVYEGDSNVTLRWPALEYGYITSFNIYRRSDGARELYDTLVADDYDNVYPDNSVTNDSTYYYSIASVDSSGFESEISEEVAATPRIRFTSSFNFSALGDSSGEISATVALQTVSSGHTRRIFGTSAVLDTAGVAWSDTMYNLGGVIPTGIASPTADADSGGFTIVWRPAENHDGYLLEFNPNDDGWVALDPQPAATDTTYEVSSDDTVPPRRGELEYRIRSFVVDGGDTTYSPVAVLSQPYENQAERVFAQFYATNDTNGTYIISSEIKSRLLIVRPEEGPDTTAPDTSGVFAGVVVDTSGADILITLSDMTINEDGQVEFQWSNNAGSDYYGDASWSPGTPSTTVGDTIHTTLTDPADMNDTYVRFRLRDDEGTPNVSGWVEHQEPFVRASTTQTDTVGFYDDSSAYFTSDVGSNAYHSRFTPKHTGVSVTEIHVWVNVTGDLDIKGAIVEVDGTRVGSETAVLNVTGQSDGWKTLTFSTPVVLSDSTPYFLSVRADGMGTVRYQNQVQALFVGGYDTSVTYADFCPASLTMTVANNRRYWAYVTYEY